MIVEASEVFGERFPITLCDHAFRSRLQASIVVDPAEIGPSEVGMLQALGRQCAESPNRTTEKRGAVQEADKEVPPRVGASRFHGASTINN